MHVYFLQLFVYEKVEYSKVLYMLYYYGIIFIFWLSFLGTEKVHKIFKIWGLADLKIFSFHENKKNGEPEREKIEKYDKKVKKSLLTKDLEKYVFDTLLSDHHLTPCCSRSAIRTTQIIVLKRTKKQNL